MSIRMEGFERFDVGVFPRNYASQTQDALGWTIASGYGNTEGTHTSVGGDFQIVEAPHTGVDRGKGLRKFSGGAGSGWPQERMLRATVQIPYNGRTKLRIAFFFTVESFGTVNNVNNARFLFRLSNASGTTVYDTINWWYRSDGSHGLGMSSIGSTSGWYPVTLGVRHYVEILADSTAERVFLYVDGNLVTNAIRAATSQMLMERFEITAPASMSSPNFVIDDFVIYDDVGDDDASQSKGPCKVDLAVPNGVIAADFTPNVDLPNWQVVGALPIDANTFVSSSSTGAKDVHSFNNPLDGRPNDDVILAVQATVIGNVDINATDVTAAIGVNGTQVHNVESIEPSGSVVHVTMKTNPNTGQALKVSDLDNLQSGYAVGGVWPSE